MYKAFFKKLLKKHFLYKTVLSFSAIGSDGLCCQSREVKEWHGCRATRGVTKGSYKTTYFRLLKISAETPTQHLLLMQTVAFQICCLSKQMCHYSIYCQLKTFERQIKYFSLCFSPCLVNCLFLIGDCVRGEAFITGVYQNISY